MLSINVDDLDFLSLATDLIRSSQGQASVGDRQLELFAASKECCVFGAFLNDKLIAVASGGILPPNQYDHYAAFSNYISQIFSSAKMEQIMF